MRRLAVTQGGPLCQGQARLPERLMLSGPPDGGIIAAGEKEAGPPGR